MKVDERNELRGTVWLCCPLLLLLQQCTQQTQGYPKMPGGHHQLQERCGYLGITIKRGDDVLVWRKQQNLCNNLATLWFLNACFLFFMQKKYKASQATVWVFETLCSSLMRFKKQLKYETAALLWILVWNCSSVGYFQEPVGRNVSKMLSSCCELMSWRISRSELGWKH